MLEAANEAAEGKMGAALAQLRGMRSELDGQSAELAIAHEVWPACPGGTEKKRSNSNAS